MDIKKLLLSLAIPLLAGGISGYLSKDARDVFDSLAKPRFAPPPWLFGPVWSVLYLLIGVSLYRVLVSGRYTTVTLVFFGVQLALNFVWSPVFFLRNDRLLALIIIVALLVFAILTACSFYAIDKLAGLLFLPYILWVCFATLLNYSLYALNR